MNRTLTLVVLALAAGCGTNAREPVVGSDGAVNDPLQQLETETGHQWTVRWREDLHTPALLEGRTAPMATTGADAERAGREFLRRYGALYDMGADDDLVADDSDTDELGMTHARFQQRVGKVPVWGGELLAHFDSDGALIRVNGRYVPVSSPPPSALQSADQARVLAVAGARASYPAVSPDAFTTSAPKLYVYPTEGGEAKLAWRVEMSVEDDTQTMALESFVDAVDGSIVHADEVTAYADGSGIGVLGDKQPLVVAANGASYILEDATRGSPATRTYSASGTTRLPGTAVRSKDPTSWDTAGAAPGAAVDAHAFVATAWDYFAKVHGRRGWDGKNKGVHTTVHFGPRYDNAFFNGKQLVFGDGDGSDFSALSGALDVVAHEFTHGVTYHTARLGMEGQNGALNEALSDIFGCFVEGNWKIGEAVYHPSGKAHALRDVADPHASNNPAKMAEYVVTDGDNGGVHVNSTIVSHAAYLMARKLPQALVEKIWYRALSRYLHSKANFVDAADATMSAARDFRSGAETAVKEAWVAVGVIE
ncbi:MAG: peptidase family protein [bacterium]|nr:peptidase family protein [bacterium]